MRVGLIGTGNMGGNRIGPKILRAGHELTVNDIRPEVAARLLDTGAQWADSPAEVAAASEVVLTSLPTPSAVEAVVLDEARGVFAGLEKGAIFSDMSTSTPMLARRIAEEASRRGVVALDSPLSSGGVFVTVGGDKEAFERARPVYEAVSEHVIHVGGPGMGQVAKLVRQHLSFSTFVVELEALMIAAKAGADVKAVFDFVGASVGRSDFHSRAMTAILNRDFGSPETATATLDIVAKDISLAVDLARHVGSPAPIGAAVSDVLERARAQGWGRHSFWNAARIIEDFASCELKA